MTKLIGVMVILCGMWEAYKAYTAFDHTLLLERVTALKGVKNPTEENIADVISLLLILPFELAELLFTIAGAVFFPPPLKWMMVGILALGYITSFLVKHSSRNLSVYWRQVDCTICAIIMIVGPIIYLG